MAIGKLLLTASVGLLLVACQSVHHRTEVHQKPPVPLTNHKYYALTPIDSLHVVGPIDVEIVSHHRGSDLTLRGDPLLLAQVNVDNTGSHLVLRLEPDSNTPQPIIPIKARISLQELHTLNYRGSGGVKATGLSSPMMEVAINSGGPVHLSGKLGISKLTLGGTGPVTIQGVSSDDLTVRAKGNHWITISGVSNLRKLMASQQAMVSLYWVKSLRTTIETSDLAYVQVAGNTDTLEIKAHDNSEVEAAYFRAVHTYTKAWEHAKVSLHALKGQHSLAMDRARIYTHSRPHLQNDFLRTEGAVLPLKRWA
jgi:hypothetical protein